MLSTTKDATTTAPEADTGSSRWTRQVSAWIQKLRPNQLNTFPDDRKLGAVSYDFEVGSKTPIGYFQPSVPRSEPLPPVKDDIFLLFLCQRKAFLLPKFHPRSLHIIEASTSANSTSTTSRSNSDPNIFGLDYYLTGARDRQSLSNLVDGHPNTSTLRIKCHDSKKKERQESFKGVKQKLRERLSWLLPIPKASVSGQRSSRQQTDESTSSFFPKFSHRAAEKLSQSHSRSHIVLSPQLSLGGAPEQSGKAIRTRTKSYPSKVTRSDWSDLQKLVTQSTDSIRLDYCSQRSSSGDSIDYCRLSSEKFSEDSASYSLRERNETIPLPYEAGRDDALDHPYDVEGEGESKNFVIATWKAFQDNVTKLTCKLRSRYSEEISFSVSKENEEELSLKASGFESKRPVVIPGGSVSEKRLSSGRKSAVRQSTEVKHPVTDAITAQGRALSFILSRSARSLKAKKMSRRRSNEDDRECSEEPLPKHLRSMSLPEEPRHLISQPVRPQRKRYTMRCALDSESGDESSKESARSPEFDKRKELQHSRKEFLEKMVSVSSDEDEKRSLPRYESRHFIQREIIFRDAPKFSPNTEGDKPIIESRDGGKRFISDVDALLDGKEKSPSEDDTGGVEEIPADKIPCEITHIELNVCVCEEELRTNDLSERNCDKLPSVIECFQKDELPETSTYNFQEITTYDVQVDVQVDTQDDDSSIFGEVLESESLFEVPDVPRKTEVECCSGSSDNEDAPDSANERETASSHSLAQRTQKSLRSDSQPHIFVTPAEVNDEEVVRKEKHKTDSIFSFVKAIGPPHRADWSRPTVPAGIALGNGSSIDSQPESSTIFSELEDYSPSTGERFNVSPNLSPSPRAMSPVPSTSALHPSTPKSPITVQEWIDSLPANISEHREEEPFDINCREERSIDAEQHLQSKEEPPKKVITRREYLHLGDEASALNGASKPAVGISKSDDEMSPSSVPTPSPARDALLTLKDIRCTLGKDEDDSLSTVPQEGMPPSKRSQFAETREKQTSFQSETSILSGTSHQTVSSIESLLESRQLDPVEILLNLGFGSSDDEEGVSRIPPRFLKPSKVPGNDINEFLKQEGNFSDFVDSSEWVVPNISSQALRRMSVKTVSPLFVNLIETVRENHHRILQRGSTRSDISSISLEGNKLASVSRFATVAKGLSTQASFARRLSTKAAQRRESALSHVSEGTSPFRNSVLLPENRRFLDLQGQRSPEAPKRRLIIGGDAFSLGNNGEILDSDDGGEEANKWKQDKIEEEEEEEEEERRLEKSEGVERSTRHRDSISSIVSSVTSIDSKEEAYVEELHQLTLSVTKGRSGIAPSTGKPLLPQEKKKSLMRRLSTSSASSKKRILASQSSSCSDHWEVEAQIKEEQSHGSSSPSPPPTNALPNRESFCYNEPTPAPSTNENYRRKSLTRQENVGVGRRGGNVEQVWDCRLPCLTALEGNWSIESRPSIETVRRFPLKRTVALVRSSNDSERTLDVMRPSEDGSLNEVHQRRRHSRYKTTSLRRTCSLPDVLGDDTLPCPQSQGDEDHEFLKTTSQSLQMSVNTAMLSLLEACKTQIYLQNHLTKAPATAKPAANSVSFQGEIGVRKPGPKNIPPLLNLSQTSVGSDRSRPDYIESVANHEASLVASQVRTSINSVISHLEHYLKDVSPQTPPASPDVTNIISQMLWHSQHQNRLCSDLEVLSTSKSFPPSRSATPSTLPLNAWALSHPFFYRSMPEQLNVGFTPTSVGISSPPSVHSAPYYQSAVPPFSPPFYAFPFLKTTPNTHTASPPKQKEGKTQPSLSECSYDGSVDLGAADTAGIGEWIDGKISDLSSPMFSLNRSIRSPDSAISDFIAEKVSQEIEENLGFKMKELSQKMDKNSAEVSEIKDKLTTILQCLNPDSRA